MNDPGLDDPIQENAREVEHDTDEDGWALERQDEQTFLNPRSSASVRRADSHDTDLPC